MFTYGIFVHTKDNRQEYLNIDNETTVKGLKEMLVEKGYAPATYRALVSSGGKVMDRDEASLFWDYQVRKDSAVHMVQLPPHMVRS